MAVKRSAKHDLSVFLQVVQRKREVHQETMGHWTGKSNSLFKKLDGVLYSVEVVIN